MNLFLLILVLVSVNSTRFETNYQSIKDLPYVNSSAIHTVLLKTQSYQLEVQALSQRFRNNNLKDFQFNSKNEAAFVLPPVPSHQTFMYFKRQNTNFIMEVAYQYQKQQQLDDHGVQLIIMNAKTRFKVFETVFVYIKSIVLEIPPGPYVIVFKNKDHYQKIMKFHMGEEQKGGQEDQEYDISKMSELSDDIRLSRNSSFFGFGVIQETFGGALAKPEKSKKEYDTRTRGYSNSQYCRIGLSKETFLVENNSMIDGSIYSNIPDHIINNNCKIPTLLCNLSQLDILYLLNSLLWYYIQFVLGFKFQIFLHIMQFYRKYDKQYKQLFYYQDLLRQYQISDSMKKLYKWTHLEQADGMYEGTITKSFEKEGFGIFMDENFDTYFGHWKNNTMHGLGLIVFNNGDIMYTLFNKNSPDALRVIRNRQMLMVGIFSSNKLHGIGFQYSFENIKWTMNRYNKGKLIQEISTQQAYSLTEPPYIMTIQQSIYKLFQNYLKMGVFRGLSQLYYLKQDKTQILGINVNGKQQGLGLIIKNNQLVEAGQYSNGLLNGYCRRVHQSYTQTGFYTDNERNGIIQITSGEQKSAFKYQYNLQTKEIQDKGVQFALKTSIRDKKEKSGVFLSIRNQIKLRNLYIEKPNQKSPTLSIRSLPSQNKDFSLRSSIKKSDTIQSAHHAYQKYKNQFWIKNKPEQQEMSSLQFVRKNADKLLGELAEVQKSRNQQLLDDGEVAQEQNPINF